MALITQKWHSHGPKRSLGIFFILLSAFGCSSVPVHQELKLDAKSAAALMVKEDCRFESFKTTESPDQIVNAFLTRESSGLLHQDQMDWLFQRELCPAAESIADYMYVVTSRSIKLLTNTEDYKEFEVEYDSKGTLLVLNDESQEMSVHWDEKDSKLSRKISLFKTEFGWKIQGPLFNGGEHLSPQSVVTLYAKKISGDLKSKLMSWVK